jgi:hypothetical protein
LSRSSCPVCRLGQSSTRPDLDWNPDLAWPPRRLKDPSRIPAPPVPSPLPTQNPWAPTSRALLHWTIGHGHGPKPGPRSSAALSSTRQHSAAAAGPLCLLASAGPPPHLLLRGNLPRPAKARQPYPPTQSPIHTSFDRQQQSWLHSWIPNCKTSSTSSRRSSRCVSPVPRPHATRPECRLSPQSHNLAPARRRALRLGEARRGPLFLDSWLIVSLSSRKAISPRRGKPALPNLFLPSCDVPPLTPGP